MLELEAVTAGYGSTVVLRDVSLVVPTGSVVALLGPNGAGKTTLLKVASGLIGVESGRVKLHGQDLTGRSPHDVVRAGVCHVPEGRGIFRSLTVRENLLLQAPSGEEAQAVDRAVSAFPRLGERLAQVAGTLSGGEQQMLALARTYVQRPSTILLDEVSMGLAPNLVDTIFEFIARLAAEGRTLLLVEQYVTKAMAVADYVYILNRGRLVFSGEPSELQSEQLFESYLTGQITAGSAP